ncbi:Gfo/Idh/MocA family protein [Aquimarina sp. RZ0]|uniref:Gfo/Idh/MocA family oxidoreductase n=1 Tax=Aquimarina sp. RZ0 TaxID=2607730 RepID=UPI0011F27B26|nr:Gfo/Idh/MocA family oxidoreductase [Aquimarina sp. RZ0]KAA1244178.1 Gfo/Idh/MocA family oxidoreductase [Aquimarina sp. RZ0]
MTQKNFALIGAAGYVAPKHLKAIKETDNNLLAALDKFDSVGVLDSYFPNTDFFVEFERFDRHLEKLKRRKGIILDYVSICTPNYLHDAHIRMALRRGADAICEKPLVLNPWNIQPLIEIERECNAKVNTVLQLRLHDSIIALKNKVANGPKDKIYDIDLTYIASRGNWYNNSWKGEIAKSGGVATNIGIHFFDMLIWIFGGVTENIVHKHDLTCSSGYLELENAKVRWFLSIDNNHIPEAIKLKNQRTYRSVMIDGEEIEFSSGFTELHTKSYREILKGNGFGLIDAKPSIQVVHDIRNAEKTPVRGEYHPLLNTLKKATQVYS